jgi:hypothetical protein
MNGRLYYTYTIQDPQHNTISLARKQQQINLLSESLIQRGRVTPNKNRHYSTHVPQTTTWQHPLLTLSWVNLTNLSHHTDTDHSFFCGSAATSGLIHDITGTSCYYWDMRINTGSEKCNGRQERSTEECGMLPQNRWQTTLKQCLVMTTIVSWYL